jgi:hypothetical protein
LYCKFIFSMNQWIWFYILIYSRHQTWCIQVIDYRCDNRRFWLSAHNRQVPTPTLQNLEREQQIRIFGAV